MGSKFYVITLALTSMTLFSDEAISASDVFEVLDSESPNESSIEANGTQAPVLSESAQTTTDSTQLEPSKETYAQSSWDTPTYDQTMPSNTPCDPIPCCPISPCELAQRIQMGGNYTYAWITPRGNPKTKGNLAGAQALYEYRPYNFLYFGSAFSWREGTTKINVIKRKLQDFNAQERFGYTFPQGDSRSKFTIFTGLGARYLAERVRILTASVHFDYVEFYVPVGFLFENRWTSILSWGVNFQWMPQVYPVVEIKPLSGARWDLAYKMNNFFVEVPLKLSTCSDSCALIASPFFELWHDGHSKARTITGKFLNLPGNKYIFAGVNVNLAFSF